MKDPMAKAKTRTISLTAAQWQRIDRLLDAHYHGVTAKYFQDLIADDLGPDDVLGVPASRITEKNRTMPATPAAMEDLAQRVAAILARRSSPA